MRWIWLAVVPALTIATPVAAQRFLSGPGVALGDVLPPPPMPGSPAEAGDLATFRATRAFARTPRWHQATADVDESVPAMLAGFAPAAGRDLSPTATPRLAALLTRMRPDVAAAVNAIKPAYARPRPFVGVAGPVCQSRDALAGSFDYPSGHASWGSAVALVLARLIPARADAILARGRDYGYSRVVCGAHSASAVAAGQIAGAAVVTRLEGEPAFRSALAHVADELATRSGGRAGDIMARIADPAAGVIVIAHRGCHAAAPAFRLLGAPENSRTALDHCVAIGVDVMETDVRMTRDGALVMIHDATVDRTTDGTGRVADLTLAQIRRLRLRADLGGVNTALTEDRVPTLDEILVHAGDRIVLNLDVKDAVMPEVIAAVERAGARGRVLVKAFAGAQSPPLAGLPPYDHVAFLPMLLSGDATGADLPLTVARQASGKRRPIGFEVPRMPLAALPALAAAARTAGGRLWANSLWDGYVAGIGGDAAAEKDPDAIWGRLSRGGVTMIQTDAPAALRAYLDRR